MRLGLALALAAAQHEPAHGELEPEHIRDVNQTEDILAPFSPEPAYCAFAAWEVPECVGHSDDTLENHAHMSTRRNVVTGIVWTVAALSVFFEFTHKRAVDFAARQGDCAKEIVRTLTQEIMSIGFIALTATVLIQTGEFRTLSDMVFGTQSMHSYATGEGHVLADMPHDVRLGHQVSELTVLFQDIHFLISCIVTTLVGVGALSFWLEQRTASRWLATDALIAEFGSEMAAYDHLRAKKDGAGFWVRAQASQQQTYLAFRSEFLDPHQGSPPSHVHPERFDFFLYLHTVMGEAIVASLHCPKWVYLIYFALFGLLLPFIGYRGRNHVCFFVLLAWLLLLVFCVLLGKLHWIEEQLRPTEDGLRAKRAGEPADTATFAKFRMRIHTRKGTSMHESLFWFGHSGPKFVQLLLQALLFGVALFLATWLHHICMHPFAWYRYGSWGVPLVLAPVSAVVLWLYPECLVSFVLVTSTEMLPAHHVILKVNATYTQEKAQALENVVHAVKRELTRAHVREAAKTGRLAEIENLFGRLPEGTQNYCVHCFKAFDMKRKGGLDRGELLSCLQEVDPDSASRMPRGAWRRPEGYTDREAEDWFRILGYAHTGVMQLQGFKCLVASITGSTNKVLLEAEALQLMMAHAGSASLQPDDPVLGPAQVTAVLKSLAPGTAFPSPGSEIIQDLLRAQGVQQPSPSSPARLAGWGTPAPTPPATERGGKVPVALQAVATAFRTPRAAPQKVSMRMLAKYLARLDAVRQCSTGRSPGGGLQRQSTVFRRAPAEGAQ